MNVWLFPWSLLIVFLLWLFFILLVGFIWIFLCWLCFCYRFSECFSEVFLWKNFFSLLVYFGQFFEVKFIVFLEKKHRITNTWLENVYLCNGFIIWLFCFISIFSLLLFAILDLYYLIPEVCVHRLIGRQRLFWKGKACFFFS